MKLLAKLCMAAAAAMAIASFTATPALSQAPLLKSGAVASPDKYGALAAREILKAGGNAVDAAVATAFTLAVTYPEAGNLGGGGFMTLYVDGKPYFLDYREMAPDGATADMYLDEKGDFVQGRSLYGNLASGVPGTVRGMAEAHRRFGKLTWKQDLAPAIRYATEGFMVTEQLMAIDKGSHEPFVGVTNFESYFGGMKAGKKFRQPELAATLQRIADNGDKEFYDGQHRRSDRRPDGARQTGPHHQGRPCRLQGRVARTGQGWLARLPGRHRAAAQLRRHRPAAAADDEAGRRLRCSPASRSIRRSTSIWCRRSKSASSPTAPSISATRIS